MDILGEKFQDAVIYTKNKKNQNLSLNNDAWKIYIKENFDNISYAETLRSIKNYLIFFRIEYANYLANYKYYAESRSGDIYSDYYKDVISGTVTGTSNYASWLRSDEYALIRELLKIAFPAGEELRKLFLASSDKEVESICDELNKSLLEKIYGKDSYWYISASDKEDISNDLSSNANLSIKEWLALKIKETEASHFNGGVLADPLSPVYPRYKDYSEFQLPDFIKFAYTSWKEGVIEKGKQVSV